MEIAAVAKLQIRQLIRDDLHRGFLDVLAALTTVGIKPSDAEPIFDRLDRNQFVYVAIQENRVVGTTALLVEQKFIHSGGQVGHIEDVAVSPELQGQGIGRDLVRYAIAQARQMGCYKVILHCKPELRPFYESLGFHETNVGMRVDLTS